MLSHVLSQSNRNIQTRYALFNDALNAMYSLALKISIGTQSSAYSQLSISWVNKYICCTRFLYSMFTMHTKWPADYDSFIIEIIKSPNGTHLDWICSPEVSSSSSNGPVPVI